MPSLLGNHRFKPNIDSLLPRRQLALFVALISTLAFQACSPARRIAEQQPITRSASLGGNEFQEATKMAVKSPWLKGNHVTSYTNGAEFYPAMLKAIRSAKKSITFETFAFVNGQTTYEFVSAFCERAKAGVNIHLILDAFGSEDFGKANLARLRAHGVTVRFYHDQLMRHPIRYYTRDHRKLIVVDGKIGFTGGCGIADAWNGNAETPKNWRENHYKITGPVVAQIQRDFVDNWIHTGGAPLKGKDYFPKLQQTGKHNAQNFISSPKDQHYTVPHLYRQALASARKSIIIENSYYLPDATITKEILAARKRGVHVELILAGKHTDAWLIRYFSRLRYHTLLKAGVHIYEYQKSMLHCKVMVVDGVFSSIGSANFDARSLYINDESNLNVLDTNFANEQLRIIELDKRDSARITKATSPWNPFTLPSRLAASALAPQL